MLLGFKILGWVPELEILIFPSALWIMAGSGHNAGLALCMSFGLSDLGSSASGVSEETSDGMLSSTNSPGHIMVPVAGARSRRTRHMK